MKHVDSESYNIAWFKLADCIARGEKERALGVYRLLSHSLDDSALACQLYADILRSFGDPQAVEKYQEAAELYRARNKIIEAAAIYEHIAVLKPKDYEVRMQLIELYQQLHIRSKVTQYVQDVIIFLLQQGDWKKAVEVVITYETAGDDQFTAALHERMTLHLITVQGVLPETILEHVRKAIDAWNALEDDNAISAFLTKLQAAHEVIAEHARNHWQAIKSSVIK